VAPPVVLVIPLFQLAADAHQLTHQNVIVIYTSLMLPFSAFLLASFVATIPRSLIAAAHIDGAGTRHPRRSVVLPLSRPALVRVSAPGLERNPDRGHRPSTVESPNAMVGLRVFPHATTSTSG
jgi:hypothetical protein